MIYVWFVIFNPRPVMNQKFEGMSGESPNLRPEPTPGRVGSGSGDDMNEYTPRQCLVLGPSQDEEGETRVRIINLNRQLREKERQRAALPASEHAEEKRELLSNAILELKAALREATTAQQAGAGATARTLSSQHAAPAHGSSRGDSAQEDMIIEQVRLAMWQNSSQHTRRILDPLSPRTRRTVPRNGAGVPSAAEGADGAQTAFLLPSTPVIVSRHAVRLGAAASPNVSASPAHGSGALTPGDDATDGVCSYASVCDPS